MNQEMRTSNNINTSQRTSKRVHCNQRLRMSRGWQILLKTVPCILSQAKNSFRKNNRPHKTTCFHRNVHKIYFDLSWLSYQAPDVHNVGRLSLLISYHAISQLIAFQELIQLSTSETFAESLPSLLALQSHRPIQHPTLFQWQASMKPSQSYSSSFTMPNAFRQQAAVRILYCWLPAAFKARENDASCWLMRMLVNKSLMIYGVWVCGKGCEREEKGAGKSAGGRGDVWRRVGGGQGRKIVQSVTGEGEGACKNNSGILGVARRGNEVLWLWGDIMNFFLDLGEFEASIYQQRKDLYCIYQSLRMQARSLTSYRTLVLVALLLLAIVPVHGYPNQQINSSPKCCDQKLLTYDQNARECLCNQKENYFESKDHKHCIHCPPPKIWVNNECRECSGPFRVWSGFECVCAKGSFWDEQSKSCLCPVNRRPRAGTNYCECVPPLVEIRGTCRCADRLQTFVNNKCVCKKGTITKKDGTCIICSAPNNWFPDRQVCTTCRSTEFFNPVTKTCQCNSQNPYRNALGFCQPCPYPGSWNSDSKTCICPPNYVWNSRSQRCICLPPNRIVDGYCQNCAGGQIWVPAESTCKCPADKPNFYKFPGQSQQKCHFCPRRLPYLDSKGNCVACLDCAQCPASTPYFYNGKCNICPQVSPNRYNDRCNKCPEETPYQGPNGQCLQCPSNEFFFNNICNKCPRGKYWFNKKCNQCPEGQFQWKNRKTGAITCHQCPQNKKYFYNKNCHVCPEKTPYESSEKFCGCSICPDASPYRYDNACHRCQKGYTLNSDNKCLRCRDQLFYSGRCHRCPKGQTFDGKQCQVCSKLQPYYFDGKCHKCPKEKPYTIMNTCRPCPSGQQLRNGECTQCKNSKDYNPVSAKCDCISGNCYKCPIKGQTYNKKLGKCI